MGRSTLSKASYKRVASKAESAGSATYAGEQRKKSGMGLHDLVDPKGYGLIRRSIGPRESQGANFKLLRGIGMLEETRLDTTGSMGDNVEIAMKVLPKTYGLLAKGKHPVLGRYDTQMITSIFGDVVDEYVLCRSQAEMDERIAEQMTYMVPEGNGGDATEDPQYGLFAGAYLTDAEINKYGLKYYDFTVTDAPCRMTLSENTLHRIFGETVFDKVKENGYQINPSKLPDTKDVVRDLLKNAHAFVLLVQGRSHSFWADIYGHERVIDLPHTELLPEVKAAIIGLTEGVVTLSGLPKYLKDLAKLNDSDIQKIVRSVSGIPIGAQTSSENFEKIPQKGDLFESKDSLWPSASGNVEDSTEASEEEEESLFD